MRLLITVCALLPISAATAEPPAPAVAAPPAPGFASLDHGTQCARPAVQPVKRGDTPQMKRLGELPPADAFHAVYRLDGDGCVDPVMVGYQFGRR